MFLLRWKKLDRRNAFITRFIKRQFYHTIIEKLKVGQSDTNELSACPLNYFGARRIPTIDITKIFEVIIDKFLFSQYGR